MSSSKTAIGMSLLAAVCLSTDGRAEGLQRDPFMVRVYPTDYFRTGQDLSSRGYDIAGADPFTSFDLILDAAGIELLASQGLSYEVIGFSDIAGSGTPDPRYKNPEQVAEALATYERAYPELLQRIQIGTSAEGRPIWAVKISSNVSADEDKPTILFDANHHAREVMAVEIGLDIIDYLVNNFYNPETPWVQDWLNSLEIWAVPLLNVDGNSAVWNGCRWQRKNLVQCGVPAGCMFSDGTDINRNYDFHWGAEGCEGSSSQCISETFRGAQPWNEEAAALRDLAQNIRPVFNISFHSFAQLVILPYGCDHTAEDAALRAVGHGIGDLIVRDDGTTGYMVGTSPEVLYTTDGTSIDWMYARLGTFSYVIEVNGGGEGFQPDFDPWRDFTTRALRPINGDQRGGWMYVLDRVSRGASLFGHVRDAMAGTAISGARIDVQQIVYQQGESPRITNRFGRYHWILLPGAYDVTFSADSYVPSTFQVSVSDAPMQLDVALSPAGSSQ